MNVSQHSGPGPPLSRGLSDRSVTGPSCRALKTAVSALYSVDDFVKEKIGSGFFSEVYKVTHRTTGQVMVLKMNQLRSNRPNMLREVQLLNKLSHPNILSFMGVCVQEGQLHALTEYMNGGSLEQLIQSQGDNLSPCVKIRLALGIARGMQYVHDAGIFHRDLTSKNVLIRKSADGLDAVVGDFGLAAGIPRKKGGGNRLDTVGSPYWMSPECLNGLWYDQTSDVFSYGIILCELIASIEADPDILPRTDSFGLDYLAFVDLCPVDTPPVFLRLAFYCCTYDPKSRPTFAEIVKKLTMLLDKINDDDSILHIISSPLTGVTANSEKAPNGIVSNGVGNLNGKRNSVDVRLNAATSESSEEEEGLVRMRNKSELKDHAPLQHRRSMSENVIVFPQHTTPSDKARCHMLNRQSKGPDSPTPDSPTYSNVTLRKVAETMFLKDPQYKPRVGGENTKLNPFTALAQLRGVKKILGANPSSYTAGVGDLFSSCFEMSSPLVKEEWSYFDKGGLNGEITPKSLPNSPISGRKEYNSGGGKCERNVPTESSVPKARRIKDGEETKEYLELDLQKCTGTIKKFKANSLFSHPLFKSGQSESEVGCNSDRTDRTDRADSQSDRETCEKEMIEKSKSDSSETVCYENNKVLNRRGSTESGFFSCLNEDFGGGTSSASYKGPCCYDRINMDTPERIPICPCCLYGTPYQTPKKDDLELSSQTLNDSNSILMFEDASTPVSSLRSLDDLELSDSRKQQRFHCRHMIGSNVDIDTRSIDMGLINRLALDSEINSLIQKSQFANQLLYCKNRTSSIYTDSSDDISSLAGSDSLLWDDRSYTAIPNTRSAQIAKIVEYFERKGQAFKQFSVPESLKTTPSQFSSQSRYPGTASPLAGCFADMRREYGFDRRYTDFKSRNVDYEAFCLELDKKPTQQRLTVCEGAVRSKLQLFDKLKQNSASSGAGSGNVSGSQPE